MFRPPAVRLAPRDELAAAARVAPLLRAARDLVQWAAAQPDRPGLSAAEAVAAADELGMTREETEAAWLVAAGAGLLSAADAARPADILSAGNPDEVLTLWTDALSAALRAAELDGLVTALYTANGPVRIDALFEAYQTARGQAPPGGPAGGTAGGPAASPAASPAEGTDVVEISTALETLADLGAVDLGTDEDAGVLTVRLSRLGTWGVHGRLRESGWQVPVAGQLAAGDAAVLLAALADYDAEEGEAEIASWLGRRTAP